MRAAYYEKKGSARDVLQIGDLPVKAPGEGEVRVRIHVSGVNPSDTKLRDGWDGNTAMPYPIIVPHNDGAGVVDAVGGGVDPARIGERVWVYEAQRDGRAFGTAAEFVNVPASRAVPLPDGVDFDAGACLGVPAMTAHRCLFADGPIDGASILVAGGGGTVGRYAVQLAKWGGAGLVVATVGSPEQADVARRAGADHVLDYKKDDVAERLAEIFSTPRGVDRVVEVAFGVNLALNMKILKPNGVIATYASAQDAKDAPSIPFYAAVGMGLTVRYTLVYVMPDPARVQALRDLTHAMEAGALSPLISRRFPLDRIAEAHEAIGIGGSGGKIVIDIAG